MAAAGEDIARFRERYMDRAIRKMKENPAVPIGALITAGCIVGASVKLLQGNSRSFNLWLRARVVSHAATTGAIAYGIYVIGQDNLEKDKEREADRQGRVGSVEARERAEFEERMKAAEENHAAEAEVLEKVMARRKGIPEPTATVPGSGGASWWSWIGLSSSKTPSSPTPTPSSPTPNEPTKA